jgi:hypothetical protein
LPSWYKVLPACKEAIPWETGASLYLLYKLVAACQGAIPWQAGTGFNLLGKE